MSENLRRYVVAMFELERVIRAVPDDAWDRPSPCADWNARDVAGHAMGVVANVAAKLGRREPVDAFADVGTIAGSDPLATWRAIRDDVLSALDHDGALRTPVRSALGDMSIDDYLDRMTDDAVVHAWDLARATGVDERLDPGLVEHVLTAMLTRGPTSGRHGYDDAVAVDPDASPQDRLVALTGRTP